MNKRLGLVKIAICLLTAALACGQEAPEPPEPPQPPPAQPAPAPPKPPRAVSHGSHRDEYRVGQSALDKRQYIAAIDAFNIVIADKGDRADGAYYWRAYAENKLGRRNEALGT